jgi:hypothetical protein
MTLGWFVLVLVAAVLFIRSLLRARALLKSSEQELAERRVGEPQQPGHGFSARF